MRTIGVFLFLVSNLTGICFAQSTGPDASVESGSSSMEVGSSEAKTSSLGEENPVGSGYSARGDGNSSGGYYSTTPGNSGTYPPAGVEPSAGYASSSGNGDNVGYKNTNNTPVGKMENSSDANNIYNNGDNDTGTLNNDPNGISLNSDTMPDPDNTQ